MVHPGGPFGRSKDDGAWSIPKGEMDEGEDPAEAALRKFMEEIGSAPEGPLRSLGEILDLAERLAAALATLGVRRGDVVTVQLASSSDFVIIYYAVARLGGVLSTLHMPYGAGEAEPILRHSRACAVFCGPANNKSDPAVLFATLALALPAQSAARHFRLGRRAPACSHLRR